MKYTARRNLAGNPGSGEEVEVGATIGTAIFPGIGTAIGAVLGAVASMIGGTGQKAQRAAAAAQFLSALEALPSTYVGRTLTYQNFADMNRAIFITGHMNGAGDPVAHPSAMDGNFVIVAQIFKYLVQVSLANPIGATINTLIPRLCAPNGCWPSVNYTFINPGLADSAVFSQQVCIPAIMAVSDKVEGSGFNQYFSDPVAIKYYDLLTDYTIGNYGMLPGTAQTSPQATANAAAAAQAVSQATTTAAVAPSEPVTSAISVSASDSTDGTPTVSVSVAPAQTTYSPDPTEGDIVAVAPNASFPWLWVILGGAVLLALT